MIKDVILINYAHDRLVKQAKDRGLLTPSQEIYIQKNVNSNKPDGDWRALPQTRKEKLMEMARDRFNPEDYLNESENEEELAAARRIHDKDYDPNKDDSLYQLDPNLDKEQYERIGSIFTNSKEHTKIVKKTNPNDPSEQWAVVTTKSQKPMKYYKSKGEAEEEKDLIEKRTIFFENAKKRPDMIKKKKSSIIAQKLVDLVIELEKRGEQKSADSISNFIYSLGHDLSREEIHSDNELDSDKMYRETVEIDMKIRQKQIEIDRLNAELTALNADRNKLNLKLEEQGFDISKNPYDNPEGKEKLRDELKGDE